VARGDNRGDQEAKQLRRGFGKKYETRFRQEVIAGLDRATCSLRVMSPERKGLYVGTDTGKHPRNRENATHKFAVGAHVLYRVGVQSRQEPFRVTRLLPDGGAGFQYRIKGEQDGFERMVTESSLEAIG
jgi:hypothetical protein